MSSPPPPLVGTNPGRPVLLSRPAWPSSLRLVSNSFGRRRLHHLQRQERRSGRALGRVLGAPGVRNACAPVFGTRSPLAARVELGRLLRPLRQRLRTPHQGLLRQRRPPRVVHLAGDRIHPAPVPVGRDEVAPPRHRRLLRELGQTFLLRLPRLVLARLAAHRGLGSAGLAAAHPAELKRALARVQGHGHVPRVGSGGPRPSPVVLGDPRILSNRCDFAFPAGGPRVLLVHTMRAVVGVPEHHDATRTNAFAASPPRSPRRGSAEVNDSACQKSPIIITCDETRCCRDRSHVESARRVFRISDFGVRWREAA